MYTYETLAPADPLVAPAAQGFLRPLAPHVYAETLARVPGTGWHKRRYSRRNPSSRARILQVARGVLSGTHEYCSLAQQGAGVPLCRCPHLCVLRPGREREAGGREFSG